MFPSDKPGQSGMNLNQLQDTAMDVVRTFCAILTRPVELILRPRHGSRYFSPVVIFGSTLVMMILPLFWAMGFMALRMIPLIHVPSPSACSG